MFSEKRKVTVEWVKNSEKLKETSMTNPLNKNYSDTEKLTDMIKTILDKELPMLKNNSLMHDLVFYSLLEKMKTVQTVENVLSYIKGNHGKEVQDVYFRNGEIRIKCSI
ncbi:MAG: hypothetical protein LUH05_01680 [Candidatus Gastranaerophilales bacterium]|nr:hypothetical protein [Candidatus Gastranaerophilales bacterium]